MTKIPLFFISITWILFATNVYSQEYPLVEFPLSWSTPLRKDTTQSKVLVKLHIIQENRNSLPIMGYKVTGASRIENGFPQVGIGLQTIKQKNFANKFNDDSGLLNLISSCSAHCIKEDEQFIFHDNAIWSYSHADHKNVYFNIDYTNEDEIKKYGDNIIVMPYNSSVFASAEHIEKKGDVGSKLFTLSLRVEYTRDQKLDIHLGTNQVFDVKKHEIKDEFKEHRVIKNVKDGDKIEILPGVERKIKVVQTEKNRRGYILFDLNE